MIGKAIKTARKVVKRFNDKTPKDHKRIGRFMTGVSAVCIGLATSGAIENPKLEIALITIGTIAGGDAARRGYKVEKEEGEEVKTEE